MTKEELFAAKELHIGCSFVIGPKGGIHEHHLIWHVTNVKTWKRDPNRFDVTLHRGLRFWDHITKMSDINDLINTVYTEKTCPALIAKQNLLEAK